MGRSRTITLDRRCRCPKCGHVFADRVGLAVTYVDPAPTFHQRTDEVLVDAPMDVYGTRSAARGRLSQVEVEGKARDILDRIRIGRLWSTGQIPSADEISAVIIGTLGQARPIAWYLCGLRVRFCLPGARKAFCSVEAASRCFVVRTSVPGTHSPRNQPRRFETRHDLKLTPSQEALLLAAWDHATQLAARRRGGG